jgi:hypothetical protein
MLRNYFIPNIKNNFEFERVKAPKINDRKRRSINSIQRRSRSWIYWQLSRGLKLKVISDIWYYPRKLKIFL